MLHIVLRVIRRRGRVAAAGLCIAALFQTALGTAADSTSMTGLNRFFDQVSTFSARFEQVVLDEGLNVIDEGSGLMLISRPGKFRWNYDPPNEQEIVSNGRAVWIYDVELEQITIRSLQRTLGETPASLLAGSADVKSNYDLRDLGQSGELAWVGMRPRNEDSGFSDVRAGFEGGVLRILEFVDGLGQTTRLTLAETRENIVLDEDRFEFVTPPGVDVIDETQDGNQ